MLLKKTRHTYSFPSFLQSQTPATSYNRMGNDLLLETPACVCNWRVLHVFRWHNWYHGLPIQWIPIFVEMNSYGFIFIVFYILYHCIQEISNNAIFLVLYVREIKFSIRIINKFA